VVVVAEGEVGPLAAGADQVLPGGRQGLLAAQLLQHVREGAAAEVGHAGGAERRLAVDGVNGDDVGVQQLGEGARLVVAAAGDLEDDVAVGQLALAGDEDAGEGALAEQRDQAEAHEVVADAGHVGVRLGRLAGAADGGGWVAGRARPGGAEAEPDLVLFGAGLLPGAKAEAVFDQGQLAQGVGVVGQARMIAEEFFESDGLPGGPAGLEAEADGGAQVVQVPGVIAGTDGGGDRHDGTPDQSNVAWRSHGARSSRTRAGDGTGVVRRRRCRPRRRHRRWRRQKIGR